MSNLRNHLRNIWQKVKDSRVLNHMGSVAPGALMSSVNSYGVAAGTAMGALGFGRPSHRAIGDRVA